MLRREHMPHMLGAMALAMIFSAASVHPQPAPSGAGGSSAMPSGGASGQSEGAGGQSAGTAGQAGSAAKAGGLSKGDRAYLRAMANVNIAEIEAGKLAQSKTQNPQVRDFAQRMIDDHTKGLAQVQQVAQAKGVSLPSTPDVKHRDMAKKLGAMSGDQFDKQYMAQGGLTDHRQADAMLKKVQTRAKDPDVKNLAKTLEGTVDQHLKLAQETSKSMKSGAATGSSGTAGSSAGGGK